MKSCLTILLIFSLPGISLLAQDPYHSNLQTFLHNQYSLPTGTWVFPNTETGVLTADIHYGNVSKLTQTVSGQDFTKMAQLTVTGVSGPQWNTGYILKTTLTVNAGDVLLLVVWMRSASPDGKVTVVMENSTTYAPEFTLEYPLQTEWQQYMIPFKASSSFAAGNLDVAFQLNWLSQTVQIGGLAMLNYGSSVDIAALPRLIRNEQYTGYEADAPWRAEAAERIAQIRMADLRVRVVDQQGAPVPGAEVEVNMLKHEFGFGSAIIAGKIAGNGNQDPVYESKLLNLDGNGHGFNQIVFENDTKWNAWEQNWFGTTPAQKVQAVQWLLDRGIQVRGHTLLWPSWGNMPSDLQNNQNSPSYLLDRVRNHIQDIVAYPGIQGKISDWDVLNEISVLNDLANAMQGSPGYPTGREIYADAFNKLLEVDPQAVTYINDYTTFGNGHVRGQLDILKGYIQEIENAGIEPDGVGFQAHIAAMPTSIPEVYDILTDFHNTFNTRAKITEFDMHPMIDDQLAARYLEDFYTICFSHESVDAILMWGFWDGAHWFGNAPLFNQDWSLKPAGEAFMNLVFNRWWTTGTGPTGPDGAYSIRGFKGDYEVRVTCGDQVYTQTATLSNDEEVTVVCSLATATAEPDGGMKIRTYPNPAGNEITVEWQGQSGGELRISGMNGQTSVRRRLAPGKNILPIDLPAGLYQLSAFDPETGRRWTQKLAVIR